MLAFEKTSNKLQVKELPYTPYRQKQSVQPIIGRNSTVCHLYANQHQNIMTLRDPIVRNVEPIDHAQSHDTESVRSAGSLVLF